MKIELSYKECCIIKHALLNSIKRREQLIGAGSLTVRNEKLELENDISCYRKIKTVFEIMKFNQ